MSPDVVDVFAPLLGAAAVVAVLLILVGLVIRRSR